MNYFDQITTHYFVVRSAPDSDSGIGIRVSARCYHRDAFVEKHVDHLNTATAKCREQQALR
jgi:hypothetical protein